MKPPIGAGYYYVRWASARAAARIQYARDEAMVRAQAEEYQRHTAEIVGVWRSVLCIDLNATHDDAGTVGTFDVEPRRLRGIVEVER